MLRNHTRWYGSDGVDGPAASGGRRRFFLYHSLQNPHAPMGSPTAPQMPARYAQECVAGGVSGVMRRLNCGMDRQADELLGRTVALLRELGSVEAVALADVETIAAVPGVGLGVARAIKDAFDRGSV